MRADGYFSIKGRLTEMIIRGGENIYPQEVEDVLRSHPEVADCCVVGVPDPHFGEAVAVWVRSKSGGSLVERDLRSFCEPKIARFKIPTMIRNVESFPLTSTGKMDKRRIRSIEIETQGLSMLETTQTA